MASWRDELVEAVKTQGRARGRRGGAPPEARRGGAHDGRDGHDPRRSRRSATRAIGCATRVSRPSSTEEQDRYRLTLRDLEPDASSWCARAPIIKVTFGEGKPREFDLAKDRHIAPADVEEYMGRRSLELVRAAYKTTPW